MLSLNRNVLKEKALEKGLPKTILARVQPAAQALRVSPGLSTFFLFVCACSHMHTQIFIKVHMSNKVLWYRVNFTDGLGI